MHRFARLLQEAPPVQWDAIIGQMMETPRSQVSRDLLHAAIEAVRLAAYVNARDLGDTHDTAVDVSNRRVRAVAKALGFSYPDSHSLTF